MVLLQAPRSPRKRILHGGETGVARHTWPTLLGHTLQLLAPKKPCTPAVYRH